MGWILALEAVAVMIAGNYLWLCAVRSLAPEFEGRAFKIWFVGPLFSRREQFTEEGWRYSRLATGAGWIGLLVFGLTALALQL
jgi:hypothetical protein